MLGIDPSSEMLKRALPKVALHEDRFAVRHVENPFAHLPLDDQRFDIVVTAYTIHHLDEDAKRAAVQGMQASLRPGGRIVVADTMFRDREHKQEALAAHADLEDEYQPLLSTFPDMFRAKGLEVTLRQIGELVWVLVAR